MNINNPITQNIISCRGLLLNNKLNENVTYILEETLAAIDTITVPSSKLIVSFCVKKVLERIRVEDLFNGGIILNLIHNLPLDVEDEKRWDFDYFLSIELSGFLERLKDISDAKEIALFICSQLYNRYFALSSEKC